MELPDTLTEISTYAFHATGIKRLTIPSSVNTIGRMIATPNTYYEVLGSPENVNDHTFSTSVVSAVDKAAVEALNSKTNVSALIVLNGGVYGANDADLVNLSYGLIRPVKDGYTFQGYSDEALTKPCRPAKMGAGSSILTTLTQYPEHSRHPARDYRRGYGEQHIHHNNYR